MLNLTHFCTNNIPPTPSLQMKRLTHLLFLLLLLLLSFVSNAQSFIWTENCFNGYSEASKLNFVKASAYLTMEKKSHPGNLFITYVESQKDFIQCFVSENKADLADLKKMNSAAIVFLVAWLLFFPNAPYMITDIFHYEERPPVPFWYDVLLVISAAWNGLILGMVSLMNVENFLSRHIKPLLVKFIVFTSLLLCGYGIFIGRFLRFNSWNILTDPGYLAYTSAHHVLLPQRYPKLWVFTVLFAALLSIIYFTLKKLPRHEVSGEL